ncbi:MAG: leucine-rich repeat protein [Candidatus Ornithomonoglobus sp.]
MKKIISILTALSLCGSMLISVPVSADGSEIKLRFDTSRISEKRLTVEAIGEHKIGSFKLKLSYDPEYIRSLEIDENDSKLYQIDDIEQNDDYYIVEGTLVEDGIVEEETALFDITKCIADIKQDGDYTIKITSADDTNSGLYDINGYDVNSEDIPIYIDYGEFDFLTAPEIITQISEQNILTPPDIAIFETKEGVSINITCDTANADIYYIVERSDGDNGEDYYCSETDDNEFYAEEDYNEEYDSEGEYGDMVEASQDEINNIVNNGRKYTGTIKLTSAFDGVIKAVSCINGSYYSEYIATADVYAEKLNDPIVTFSVEDGRIFVSMNMEYEDAEIYYTTDGTIPNLTSKKFTYDLIFSQKNIPEITARAYLDGYVCSNALYRKYTSSSDVTPDGALPSPVILWSQIGTTDYASVSISGYYGAEIYYYISRYDENGEEVHGSPRLYTDSFQAEEGTTVCAYVIKNGFLKSDVSSELIDFTEPEYPFITSDWAKTEVVSAYNTGLLPYELETQNLTEHISRGEFAAIAVALYEKLSGQAVYADIEETPFVDCTYSEYASYIAAAYEIGITDGVDDDNMYFHPDDILNREQLVTMLCRVIKKCYLTDWTLSNDSEYKLDIDGVSKYPDNDLISDYAKTSVYYMSKFGVIDSDGNFNPTAEQNGIATIEQAVLIALRVYNVGERFDPDYTEFVSKREANDTTISENAIASGACGENVVWEIDEYGVMTIKGNGTMNDRITVNTKAPWNDYVKDITAVVVKNGVKSIGDYAFANMSNMKRIILPRGLEQIGTHAFYKCTSLEIIEITDAVSLEKYAFSGCVSLKYITVPYGVNRIETGLFEGCTSLQEVIILSSVRTIASNAFSGCTSLESMYIPKGVISIEANAFTGCSNLREISFGGNRDEWRAALYSGNTSISNNITVTYAK